MRDDQQPSEDGTQSRQDQGKLRFGDSRPGPLGKLLATIAWAVLLVFAFTFSLVLFVVLVVVGLLAGAYLWWKTRELRRRMRERPPGGRVIEGEVIRD